VSKKGTVKQNTAVLQPAASSSFASYWPEDFCRPRTAMIIAITIVAWGLIMIGLAYMNRLHGVRILLAWWMNLSHPELVSKESWDIAALLWIMVLTVGAGIVHPSLGLIVLALFRPWHDGYTYFEDNVYFLWGIWFLFAVWAIRQLFRGDRFRMGIPALLIAGFAATTVITMVSSIQFDNTYRQVLLWIGYGTLFVLTCNTVRSRKVMGILLTGLVISIAAETIFSILQFHYMLSALRNIAKDPRVLQYFFDTNVMTPELARRLNVNRAFGTMLFPNALAGFLILSIPYSVAGAILGWRALIPAWRLPGAPEDRMSRRYKAVAIAMLTWFVVLLVIFVSGIFVVMWQTPDVPMERVLFGVGGIAAVLALAPAVLLFWVADNRGILISAMAIRAAGLSLLALMQGYALWITYSRGAMLSLAFAALTGLVLWFSKEHGLRWMRRGIPTAGLLIIIGLMTAQTAAPGTPPPQHTPPSTSTASTESPKPNSPPPTKINSLTEVTEEGITLSWWDLLNPASWMLRVSYWRVGLTMFWNHFWTGVGLGNFGIAYVKYQYIGAGPVRLAHNGYLQAFCETGVLGGLMLLAFWGYFIVWGAIRILRQTGDHDRLLLIGLYVGVLAFLFHSAIDINFQHPSLMMFAMLFCGLFYAVAFISGQEPEKSAGAPWKRQVIVLPMLVITALAMGMSSRVWQQDAALNRMGLLLLDTNGKSELDKRFSLCQFFLNDPNAINGTTPAKKPQVPFHTLMALIPNAQELMTLGVVYAPLPDTPKGMRRLKQGESIPEDAVLVVTQPAQAFDKAWEYGTAWVQELERIDRRFPHSPDLALHIAQWCDLFVAAPQKPELANQRKEFAAKLVMWSQEALRRSPVHPDMHLNVAQAYWAMGNLSEGAERFSWLEKALDEFKQASVINRATAFHLRQYMEALQKVSEAYRQAGDAAQADALSEQVKAVQEEIKAIRDANQKLKKKKTGNV